MRRAFVEELHVGRVELASEQGRHLRDVLRLNVGDAVELFTAEGESATGTIETMSPRVVVRVENVVAAEGAIELVAAAAVPKGDRADWMVEKLSEIGVARFIPLIAARSVVVPEGKNKIDRWRRLAVESAKQSKRSGVMTIDPPTAFAEVVESFRGEVMWIASTERPGAAASEAASPGLVLIGPEGGWTNDELDLAAGAKATFVRLTRSVLRVETAAVLAAGIALTSLHRGPSPIG